MPILSPNLQPIPWSGVLTGGACAALVTAVNFFDGGYFDRSWGWIAVCLLWCSATALLTSGRLTITPLPAAFLAATFAFLLWVALSATWSVSVPRSLREVERDVVYLAFAATVAILGGKLHQRSIVFGTFVGGTCVVVYGLATRLFPERLGTFDAFAEYRLSEPVGYWNGLGLLATLTLLLGLGIAARGGSAVARCLAAAALAPGSLALYFTFSRGGWIALGVGLAVVLALDLRRLATLAWLAALAVLPAVLVAVASQQDALTTADSPLSAASREGHRLALLLVGLTLVQAGVAAAAISLESRLRLSGAVRSRLELVLAGAAVVAVIATVIGLGGPGRLTERARDAFAAPPVTARELNERLLNLSGTGRASVWDAAWDLARANPVVGAGAGTFELAWFRERPSDTDVRDAHNLYLETLAEVGLVGLVLLVVMLGIPVLAAARVRSHPFAPFVTGAYLAFVSHAAFDWDWELVGVTLVALLCAAFLLVAASDRGPVAPSLVRVPAVVVILSLSAFAMASFVGHQAIERGRDRLAAGAYQDALTDARLAERLLPWSAEPPAIVGAAELRLGSLEAGRAALRRSAAKDPADWVSWYRLAVGSSGVERQRALARARTLNPREQLLTRPG